MSLFSIARQVIQNISKSAKNIGKSAKSKKADTPDLKKKVAPQKVGNSSKAKESHTPKKETTPYSDKVTEQTESSVKDLKGIKIEAKETTHADSPSPTQKANNNGGSGSSFNPPREPRSSYRGKSKDKGRGL